MATCMWIHGHRFRDTCALCMRMDTWPVACGLTWDTFSISFTAGCSMASSTKGDSVLWAKCRMTLKDKYLDDFEVICTKSSGYESWGYSIYEKIRGWKACETVSLSSDRMDSKTVMSVKVNTLYSIAKMVFFNSIYGGKLPDKNCISDKLVRFTFTLSTVTR